MCDPPLNIGQAGPERHRAQLRAAAEIIGIDEAYLSRMIQFFVARVRANKRLGRFSGAASEDDGSRQVARMTAFWLTVALHTDDYTGDLIAAHRKLPDLRPDDFALWLELFRATLDETAPTPEAASYLMTRAERVAQHLQTAIFGEPADAMPEPPRQRHATGKS